MTAKEMREKRVSLSLQARGILDFATAEKRDLSAEEQTNFDAIHAEIDALKGKIDVIERQERTEAELRASQGTRAGGRTGPTDGGDGSEQRTAEQAVQLQTEAFRNWLMVGMNGLSPEHRQAMSGRMADLSDEQRAMAAGLDTAGGYTVPTSLQNQIETAMLPYAGIRNTRATILRTATGNPIQMPTSNDTSNKGARLAENTAVGEQDLTIGSKTIRSYMYTSKLVRVSLQFLRDTGLVNAEAWLAARLGERIGRILGTEFITGTGNNMPEGLASAATLGVTGASTSSITYDEFVDMEHSVNGAYRRQGEWLLSDGLLKAAKKLKDGEGRPLWVPGMAVNAPDTILRYRYTVDEEIPTPATTAITAYFGDFSKFHIRDVGGMQMLRLTERYAEYLQVAFLLFSSHDSVLLDAGTNPIKYFKQAT